MSASAKSSSFWTGHIKPSRTRLLLWIATTILGAVVFFKLKPYYVDRPVVNAYIRDDSRTKKAEGGVFGEGLNILSKNIESTTRSGLRSGTGSGRAGISRASAAKVLERPLFDGKNVTLKVRLTTALDSDSGDPGVEGQILGVVDSEQSSSMDAATVRLATLRGSATPNFETKRYMTQFRELLTSDGKLIQLTGVAYTTSDSMLGIPAEYSSGLPSRLFGTALNRVIVAADTVAESRVLDDGSGSAVDRELGRLARQGSSETANGLGDEASKGLRETKAVLRVQAGQIIFVKTQVSRGMGGVR